MNIMKPKITITQRLLDKYPFARFIGFTATNLMNKKTSTELEKEKRKVEKYIKENYDDFKEDIERKSVFFKKYKKSFPIGYQLPPVSPLAWLRSNGTQWRLFLPIYQRGRRQSIKTGAGIVPA